MTSVAARIGWLRKLSHRQWFICGFLAVVAMELTAIYFQFVLDLEPCPLCITQRLILIGAGAIFLAGAIHNPNRRGVRVYAGFGILTTLLGMGVAIYHFVIQLLPHDELAECGPGASYILEHMELAEALRLFLSGTGDCTQIVWSLFGLSMPFWVAVGYAGLTALSLLQLALAREPAR